MSKGAYRFKETDFARFCRVALKAGANKVRCTKEGHFESEFGARQAQDSAVNEWTDWTDDKTAA
jgi:hypothetical protein